MKRLVLACVLTVAALALGGMAVLASPRLALSPVSRDTPPHAAQADAAEATEIRVNVLARGGKFIGDDIGGAEVTLRDARTGEFLAAGRTRGSAGDNAVMTTARARTAALSTTGVAVFTATLRLDAPRLVEFEAYGPLGAQGAAQRVTTTEWVLPASLGENRVLLEIPGLNVEVINPPTHWLPSKPPLQIPLRVNVTMMCGCPIGPQYVWKPQDYTVKAVVTAPDGSREVVDLEFDANAPDGAPSQFVGAYTAHQSGVYQVDVIARQAGFDNTGSNHITFILP